MTPQKIMRILLFLLPAEVLPAQQDPGQLSYINSYKDIAIREMMRTGIPASITLAQAILESGAGQSELARNANNHFGIKCGGNWPGPVYQKNDDDLGPGGEPVLSCFRAYPTIEASFIDHSDFLADPRKAARYGPLFDLDNTDYRNWAYGLREAGYATSESYPERLMGLIERYGLFRYDLVFPERKPVAVSYTLLKTTTNDVPHTLASGYETAGDIAYRTGVPLGKLLDYNERLVDGYVLPWGEKIYLSAKRSKFQGPLDAHEVDEGETVYAISQRYGIREEKLRRRNRLEPGQQPAVNEALKLRGSRVPEPPDLRSSPDEGFSRELSPEPPARETTVAPNSPDADVTQPHSEATLLPVRYHTVEKDDTLWNIAQRYGISVEQLKRLNALGDNHILRGMRLRVW